MSDGGSQDATGPTGPGNDGRAPQRRAQRRKQMLLRLDPLVHDALARWADDELRSANAQVEFLLRKALADAGRLPKGAGGLPRRGRPPKTVEPREPAAGEEPEAPEGAGPRE
ncbi:hypothetical protein ACH4FX_19370 [Streptomyces sp. NPDC018019]|uniref:hypothetical protein n=1 Tax=Streptomyces sp. NPDC018019 TaxID=3365030 RepID=UPI0037AC1060